MRNTIIFYLIISLAFIALTICSYIHYKNVDETNRLKLEVLIYIEIEKAYFEGQRDALNGDVRIEWTEKNNDSCWVWRKTCWDTERTPTFDPSAIHSRTGKK